MGSGSGFLWLFRKDRNVQMQLDEHDNIPPNADPNLEGSFCRTRSARSVGLRGPERRACGRGASQTRSPNGLQSLTDPKECLAINILGAPPMGKPEQSNMTLPTK